jgi:hypothetical protein
MKGTAVRLTIAATLASSLASCGAPAPSAPATVPTLSALTAVPPSPVPTREGAKLVVSSLEDSGPSTLREAIQDAWPGDTITFDTAVFAPDLPAAIQPLEELPPLSRGQITIDASNAGVILDGSRAGSEWVGGLVIDSDSNVVRGLQIANFSGAGIILREGSAQNIIGGDPNVGSGPLGQTNMVAGNADGIGIFGAHDNTIVGNMIGTDISGTQGFGNRAAGIFLQDGSRNNTIGPENVIAFNESGVEIRDADSYGNTITRNSIHDNAMSPIVLPSEPGFAPGPPTIFDFDLAAGTVAGVTCSSCVVEIFSDEATDATTFEAGATASADGSFSVSAGHAFTGPRIAGTTTAADGATSALSTATSGASQILTLQQENGLPRTSVVLRYPPELKDTRIGDTFSSVTPENFGDPASMAAHSASLGHTWIRLTFGPGEWSEVTSTGLYTPLDFGDFEDQLVDDLNAQGVMILYDLLYFNKDLKVAPGASRFSTDEDIQEFVDYARMVVEHFKGRIRYYETWNEPDLAGYGQQGISPQNYINMVSALAPAIREADPQAKIVLGGGSDLSEPQVQAYVKRIVTSSLMPLVDGISLHPMYESSPDYGARRAYYYAYPEIIEGIKKSARDNGFSGEFFAEEMAWRTHPILSNPQLRTYPPAIAAKYYGRGIVMTRGLGLWAGIGGEGYAEQPAIAGMVQNINTIMAGAQPIEDLPVQIEATAARTRSYAFALPSGEKLIALWNDGGAADAGPGIPANITLSGLSAQSVAAIDPVFSFEQQLVRQVRAGNLVVPGLLLRDYPVFLHVTP